MKVYSLILAAVISILFLNTVNAAEMIRLEEAMEEMSLKISLDQSLHGFVEGKICDTCKTLRVKISPDTKAFENDVSVPLITAKKRFGKSAMVYFDPKTKKVTRIRWFTGR